MPEIRFRLGLCPGPRWGAPPDPLVGWEWGYPLPIPHPLRRLRRLDFGVPNFISRKLATLAVSASEGLSDKLSSKLSYL